MTPQSVQQYAIVKMLKRYPDASSEQVARFLGVPSKLVSNTRSYYGLCQRRHPPLIGPRRHR